MGATSQFQSSFPSLVSTTNSLTATAQGFQSSLASFASLYDQLDSSQHDFQTDLISLVEQRAQDAISYEAFLSALLAMDSDILAADLSTLSSQLELTQTSLSEVLDTLTTEDTETDEAAATIEGQIQSLRSALKTQTDNLPQHQATIEDFATKWATSYYGDKDTLTRSQMLIVRSRGFCCLRR